MTKSQIRFNPVYPSMFEIISDLKTVILSGLTPFADLMLHPEKIEAVLSVAPIRVAATATAPKKSGQKAPSGAPSGKQPAAPAPAPSRTQPDPKKKTKFSFKIAQAKSVKVAGDFTNWEKNPVALTLAGQSDWSTVIELAPGVYAYRFIVDGQWHDDPSSQRKVANSFGSHNAVIEII
jgi:hypothetical protein